MLSYKESLKILKEANALIEGHFILSSGLHSPQYVQCAQLMSKPDKAKKICESKPDEELMDFQICNSADYKVFPNNCSFFSFPSLAPNSYSL